MWKCVWFKMVTIVSFDLSQCSLHKASCFLLIKEIVACKSCGYFRKTSMGTLSGKMYSWLLTNVCLNFVNLSCLLLRNGGWRFWFPYMDMAPQASMIHVFQIIFFLIPVLLCLFPLNLHFLRLHHLHSLSRYCRVLWLNFLMMLHFLLKFETLQYFLLHKGDHKYKESEYIS